MAKKKRNRQSYLGNTVTARKRQISNLKVGGNKYNWRTKALKSAGLSKAARYPDLYAGKIISFLRHHFFIKETKRPIVLLDWQRQVLRDIFYVEIQPKLAIAGSVKKSGKSCLAAGVCLYYLLNVKMSESYILAPDLDAGKDVIFKSLKQAIRMHPILVKNCKITKDTVYYGDSFVKVLPNDISVAGLRPNLTVIDEAWQFRQENSIRTLDEMTTNPVGEHLTFCVTTAGYQEDCSDELHLWRWYCRGKNIQEGREPADPNFYFYWKEDYSGVPWVEGTNYLEHQRKILSPSAYLRFHENQWASAISTFTTPDVLDACFDRTLRPTAPEGTRIVCAIDAGVKWDCSALVALAKDETKKRGVYLVDHRIYEPKGKTIEFQRTIERTILNWNKRYKIVDCWFDPYALLRSAQFLRDERIKMAEYTQTVQHMVSATQSLDELIHSGNIRLYPNTVIRQHLLSASTKEHAQGIRIVKTTRAKKIDFAIALAMAVEAAMAHFLTGSQRKGRVLLPGRDRGDDFSTEKFLQERMKQIMGNAVNLGV